MDARRGERKEKQKKADCVYSTTLHLKCVYFVSNAASDSSRIRHTVERAHTHTGCGTVTRSRRNENKDEKREKLKSERERALAPLNDTVLYMR